MTFTSDSIFIGTDPIYYLRGGSPDHGGKAPVIFLHGLAGSVSWWSRNMELAARYAEVLALDLPGFGYSIGPSERRFELEDEISAVAAWMSTVGVSSGVLVGHSLGAYVATALAARSPELVVALILVDPAIFPPDYGSWRLAAGLVPAPFAVQPSLWPLIVDGTRRAGMGNVVRFTRALLRGDLWHALSRVHPPTLIVRGRYDTIVPSSLAVTIKDQMKTQVVGPLSLKGGHVSMWDDPAGFNDIVHNFYSRISNTDG